MYRTKKLRFSSRRLRWPRILAGSLFLALLAACAGKNEAPEKTLILDLAIEADERVNADAQGRPAPIQLQIFELKSRAVFDGADFFSMQGRPRQTLGNDLTESHEAVLRPSDRKSIKRRLDGQTVAIGVIAGYRDLGHAVWRATYILPARQVQGWFGSSNQTVRLRIKVGADTVSIAEAE